jgi:hypothetical protein
VRVASKLPRDDGLQAFEADLRELREPVVAVVELYPRHLVDRLDDPANPHEVVVGVSRIEPLSGDEASAARALLAGAYERRTGRVALPFGVVSDWPEEEE